MVQQRHELSRAVGHVEQRDHPAHRLDAVIGDEEFGQVGELDADAVALLQARREP